MHPDPGQRNGVRICVSLPMTSHSEVIHTLFIYLSRFIVLFMTQLHLRLPFYDVFHQLMLVLCFTGLIAFCCLSNKPLSQLDIVPEFRDNV